MTDGRYAGSLDQVKTASGLNITAGIWLIISPFLLGYAEALTALWNHIIVGVLVVVLASYRVANPSLYPGLSWTNVVLGLWLILGLVIGVRTFRWRRRDDG
jgi:hypothetical protein